MLTAPPTSPPAADVLAAENGECVIIPLAPSSQVDAMIADGWYDAIVTGYIYGHLETSSGAFKALLRSTPDYPDLERVEMELKVRFAKWRKTSEDTAEVTA